MGLFDKGFALPSIKTAFTSAVSQSANQAVSFAVAGASQKISEAASGMMNTFGGVGSFTKIAANLPSIEEMTSKAILQGEELTNDLLGNYEQYLGDDSGSTPSATQVKQAAGVQTVTVAHKVCLRELGATGTGGASSTKTAVYFEVMPEIVEQHQAEYEAVAPSQFPGAFQKYKGTTTTQWTINVTFISRTSEEATQNYDNVQRLKGWSRPFFGKRTGESYPTKLGAPPPVLMLTGLRDLVGPVPVVITSLSITWPKDVDYIPTTIQSEADGNYIPFPTVFQLPIQLVESYSIEQFNSFSLADYRAGRLGTAFNNIEDQTYSNVPSRGTDE